MTWKRLVAIAIVIAVGFVGTILAGGLLPSGLASAQQEHREHGAPSSAPAAGAPTIAAVAVDFKFTPPEIRIKAGQTVNLVLTNRGAILHDLIIPGLKFHAAAEPGKKGTASLTAAKPGTYEFYCSVPGHREAGMKGRLIVTR
ncbi:MAG: cupredoxin domain-containing protein [Armatimonadetes bacterium]|nr:cupredoxin domain-containing protein [Armatimonadota bacterium]